MELTAIAAWLNTAWAGFDQAAAVAVHQLYETAGGFFTPVLVFISFLGKGGACLIVFSFGLCLFPKTRRFGTAMLLGLAVGALITNLCLKPLVLRPQALHPGGQRILPVLAAFGPAYGERFQLSLRAYHRGYGGVYGGVSGGRPAVELDGLFVHHCYGRVPDLPVGTLCLRRAGRGPGRRDRRGRGVHGNAVSAGRGTIRRICAV